MNSNKTKNPHRLGLLFLIWAVLLFHHSAATAQVPNSRFRNEVVPAVEQYCFDCHGDGAEEGGFSFDRLLAEQDESLQRETWHRVLKQVRADLMPPLEMDQPTDQEIATLESWIIEDAFGLDPSQPDPGKVTIRRLNRVEYRNTIRDLLDYDYDTNEQFPSDDTGHGFDNIGDVLSISPLLLEKYFDAANEIVSTAVPVTSRVVKVTPVPTDSFKASNESEPLEFNRRGQLELSYYKSVSAEASFEVEVSGSYQVEIGLVAVESYVDNVFDLNECEFEFLIDGNSVLKRTFVRQPGSNYDYTFDREFDPGKHQLGLRVTPIGEQPQVRQLRLILKSANLVGPNAAEFRVKPENYDRFFPREVPRKAKAKKQYAAELVGQFAERAFRRPVDERTIERLTELAEATYQRDGESFESGIAKAMTAVLASPRFVFREEFAEPSDPSESPLIDEHSLASRLSYFLWSTMPDPELIRLANEGRLRDNLDAQIERMMADHKFDQFVKNYTGQWLQGRAVQSVPISDRSVLRRETPPDPEADRARRRFFELLRRGDDRTEDEEAEFQEAGEAFRNRSRGPRIELSWQIRRAMQRETEMLFEYVIKQDRSLLELIDNDYTFLNQDLAGFYGIEGVEGDEFRKVELSSDSHRGGVLTQGTTLVVTSNPDRTSPVKRGLFVLENFLGTPTAAPPPNIPSLEDVENSEENPLSLRESLEIHRKDPLCSSCHNRMDPLGLALENFNAMGRYRDQEFGKPIDTSGELITGEAFENVSQLKKILVTSRRMDIYRCLTEKMMTYALGRAVEYTDLPELDRIVAKLESNGGQAKLLLTGIIHSPAFQRTSRLAATDVSGSSQPQNTTSNQSE